MTKTITLDEVQAAAMLFLLGGRHQTQLEPHQKAALGDVEQALREQPFATAEAPAPEMTPSEENLVAQATGKKAGRR